jgi:hypothetical protein
MESRSENVILVVLDGVRTQEMFGGLDKNLVTQIMHEAHPNQKVEDQPFYKKYWAETVEERRQKVMPWFWSEFLKNYGCIVGDRQNGSVAQVANKFRFSYPGYSELLTGTPQDAINTNDFGQNVFPTICEYIKERFQLDYNQVAVFASWRNLKDVAERKKGTVITNAGYDHYDHSDPLVRYLSDMQFKTLTPFKDVRHDSFTHRFALTHLNSHKPKFMFLGYGEPDDWAHHNRYDLYLESLNQIDHYLKELWEFITSDPHYAGKTSLIITTDHGRGETLADWHNHDFDIEGAQYVWMAFGSPSLSHRGNILPATSSEKHEWRSNQVAATLLELLGVPHTDFSDTMGKPIDLFFKKSSASTL